MKELKLNINIEKLKNDVLDGHVDALLFLGQLKKLESKLKILRDITIPVAIDEFDLQGEKSYLLGGFEFSKTSGGRYSYKHSDEWLSINERKKELEKKMQSACKSNINEMIDGETGEVVTAAYYIPSKESIAIKIKN